MDFRTLGRLGVNDQEQPGTSRRYGVDWSRQLGRDGFIRVGVDRLEQAGQAPLITPVVAGTIPLPWNQRLQVTYVADRTIRTFQVQIGGPLWQHRALTGVDGGMTMVLPVSLGGQVYQDANVNGRFDPSVDRPIADLRIWLDDRQSAVTDDAGYFRFDGVMPGTHRLRAELMTLAANMIFRDGDTRMVAAMPVRREPPGLSGGSYRAGVGLGDGRHPDRHRAGAAESTISRRADRRVRGSGVVFGGRRRVRAGRSPAGRVRAARRSHFDPRGVRDRAAVPDGDGRGGPDNPRGVVSNRQICNSKVTSM